MTSTWLARLDRWLRAKQDPRYRNAPWFLPRVWQGGGRELSAAEYEHLELNVRDAGLDPAVIARQPHNRWFLTFARGNDAHTSGKD